MMTSAVLIPAVCRTPVTYLGGGGGVGRGERRRLLSYMGYIGMCGPKGYGFSAILVINRVSILADFGHFGHEKGMVFVL